MASGRRGPLSGRGSGRPSVGLGDDERPSARVLNGHGNNGQDGTEDVHKGNVIGTYLHGPLLPDNVWLGADRLIERALDVTLDPMDDPLEEAAHASARV